MPLADRDKWNAIYRARRESPALIEPAALLTRVVDKLPTNGLALDFGGGGGRNAVWLARRGLEVTVADISSEGLLLASERAAAAGVSISTLEIDLETQPLEATPRWSLIASFNFLHRPIFAQLTSLLAEGGVFVFCQPTASNLERHAKPSRRFLLADGELESLVPSGLEIEHLFEGWRGPADTARHEAELVCRYPKPEA